MQLSESVLWPEAPFWLMLQSIDVFCKNQLWGETEVFGCKINPNIVEACLDGAMH